MQSNFKLSLFKLKEELVCNLKGTKMNSVLRKFFSDFSKSRDTYKYQNEDKNSRRGIRDFRNKNKIVNPDTLALREENKLVKNLIENYDEPVKISEEDIHKALEKTGKLPENELKEIINTFSKDSYQLDVKDLREEIKTKVLSKLNLNLNKSIAELCKTAKKNPKIFADFEEFWLSIENELKTREDSLTNEQISDIISSYSKCELTPNIKIYETFEDVICDSPIPFNHNDIERILYSYFTHKKGSTPFLKIFGRRFMRYKDVIDSSRLARFVCELNSHPQTIKGNFGFLLEVEEKIKNEIERKEIKFVDLISIAGYLFKDNLGSNDIQHLIELSILEKFENKIEIEISQIIKLVKAISDYYIKNEELCYKIKNVIETYLNGYIHLEDSSNKDQIKNINIEFNEHYIKLITNLNILIWSFSRNQTFLNLRKTPEFNYFYNRLKEIFIKNLEYFNPREFTFSIEGILKILNKENSKEIFTYDEINLINEKISKIQENFKAHEAIKLLTILLTNSFLIRNGHNSIELLFEICYENIDKMSYQDLIQFMNISHNFSPLLEKIKFGFIENRLSSGNILSKMNINSLCILVKTISIPQIHKNFSKDFYNKLKTIFYVRINEIPKEEFCQVLANSAEMKISQVVQSMLDILEDLSEFEKLVECFNKPDEVINLLWSMLSIYLRSDWNLKLNQKESNFVEKILRSFLICNSDKDSDKTIMIENLRGLLINKMGIMFKSKDNLLDREENLKKFIQVGFLSFLYLKEAISDLSRNDLRTILEIVVECISSVNSHFDLDARNNFISLDSASKCNKEILEDLQKEILYFFKRKLNTSIFPNFIDEFMNPVNTVVYFETPKIKSNEKITGIDSKRFAVFLLNEFYFNNDRDTFALFDNRFKILKEVFKWEIIKINEEKFSNLTKSEEKQQLLKNLIGVDFDEEENLKIKIEEVEEDRKEDVKSDNSVEKVKSPRYKLTKTLLKSNAKKI